MANKIKLNNGGCIRTNILTTPNGNGRYLNKIIFYDNNGIIFENDGILQVKVKKIAQNGKEYHQSYDFNEFELIEPIKKNKVDLSIKKNFYITSKNYLDELSYDLYIYCNGNTDSPKTEQLTDKLHELKKGETHIYNNYLFNNVWGFVYELEKVTPETPTTAQKFFIGGEQYTRKKTYYNSFIMEKFNRIERTEQAEKLRELEHILYKDYNIGIEKAQKIKELLQKYKKWLGGNKND